ncbi:MAG TPA: hypothetical protein VGP08_11395 [Pyrinomonadaceae bacterium]|nr:hypothetical protein [Pyrinomonadaceae bacterium]
MLAALFVLYGGAHLLAAAFVWLIIFALAREGYSGALREPKTLALFCAPLLAVAPPLLSAYSLLRGRLWAGRAVSLTCAAVIIFCLIVSALIAQPRLSATRAAFGIIYFAASAALCFYGIWFVKKRGTV